jgi:hypothetical protein
MKKTLFTLLVLGTLTLACSPPTSNGDRPDVGSTADTGIVTDTGIVADTGSAADSGSAPVVETLVRFVGLGLGDFVCQRR